MVMIAMMKTMTMKLPGVSMSRLLTDADTEAMVQRVQPEERDEVELFSFLLFIRFRLYLLFLFVLVVSLLQVNVLLERHKELRRKKSANSFRREGVTQVIGKSGTLQCTGVEPGLISSEASEFFSSEASGPEQQPAER